MKQYSAKRIISIIVTLLLTGLQTDVVFAVDPNELRNAIEQKAKELDAVNKQIQATQSNLQNVQGQGKTLKQELSRIDYNINQVNLNIQSSELTIQKLTYEVESLQNDITQKEQEISQKRAAVADLLQSYQEKDSENMLMMFLNNKTLAQSLAEAQSISDLNDGLLEEVSQIKQLKTDLNSRLDEASGKKKNIEAENQTLKSRKAIIVDQRSDRQALLTQTKNQEKLYQQTISALEKQQADIGEQIDAIETQLRATFDSTLLPIKRPGVFAYPVANPVMTQAYGATKFAQKAYSTKFHNGMDFAASIGVPIYAADDGEVTMAGNNGRIQYGKFVLIKHGNNLSTLYGHMSRQAVVTGQTVSRGQLIGYSGNTGYAFGAHLHFGVYWTPSVSLKTFPGAGLVPVGITINPADYL